MCPLRARKLTGIGRNEGISFGIESVALNLISMGMTVEKVQVRDVYGTKLQPYCNYFCNFENCDQLNF